MVTYFAKIVEHKYGTSRLIVPVEMVMMTKAEYRKIQKKIRALRYEVKDLQAQVDARQ